MRFSSGKIGRVFVVRLENGDRVPGTLEEFAAARKIARGFCILVGGVGGGRLVTGPARPSARPVEPLLSAVAGVHEIAGVGTFFPDGKGAPRLHMHAAVGRRSRAKAGCVRPGLDVWELAEAVIVEIVGSGAVRRMDPGTGFAMLEP